MLDFDTYFRCLGEPLTSQKRKNPEYEQWQEPRLERQLNADYMGELDPRIGIVRLGSFGKGL